MAAYDLARKDGASHEAATEYATRAVEEGRAAAEAADYQKWRKKHPDGG
jgi:hypothetical protein